jgi:hypothetical protein
VHDEDQVAGVQAGPRLQHRADPGQFDEMVAPADRAEAVGARDRGHVVPGRVGRVGHLVEVRETRGQFLRHGALELDREDRDAAADVGADQERVEHRRRHRGADRGAFAGVQVGHAGDVPHAVEGGHLVALVDGGGLDPAGRGRENMNRQETNSPVTWRRKEAPGESSSFRHGDHPPAPRRDRQSIYGAVITQ